LILVDSSVWIDFFSKTPGPGGHELRRLLTESEPVALTGLIVTEVLQGLRWDVERIERQLSLWDLLEPLGFETYRHAAGIARLARSRGMTLTTIDALIATIALENEAVLFTLDKDFGHIANFAGLKIHRIRARS
jgi:predicted nucleic acid-binding protein